MNKIYGCTIVSSACNFVFKQENGPCDYKESLTKLATSEAELKKWAYKQYKDIFDSLGFEGGLDYNERPLMSEEEFNAEYPGGVLIQCDDEHYEFDFFEQDLDLVLEVPTSAGVIRAEKSADPGQPGIAVTYQPAGYDCEVDTAYVSVYEDEGYRTSDNERPVDLVIMSYGDIYSEDYTKKDIIRREDVQSALSSEEEAA